MSGNSKRLQRAGARASSFVLMAMLCLLLVVPVTGDQTGTGGRLSSGQRGEHGVVAASFLPPSADRGLATTCDWSGQAYDDFYQPPDLGVLTPDRLGEILRLEHIKTYTADEIAWAAGMPSEYGAELYRLLYLSQTPLGEPQAVSGLLGVPTPASSPGSMPVLAWAHGTTGLNDFCAPSREDSLESNYDRAVEELLHWIPYGYLVTATDYVGLGTPGIHTYMVGDSAAFSTLDAARAGLRFCDEAHGILEPPATNQVFLAGHSQGGHAVLFSDQEWEGYQDGAPALNVRGVLGFAPVAEPRLLVERIAQDNGARDPLAPLVMALYSYGFHYGEAPGDIPGDPPDLSSWLNEPYATDVDVKVQSDCLGWLSWWLRAGADTVFQPDVLQSVQEGRWDDLEPYATYLEANTPDGLSLDLPVLILQGEQDKDIPLDLSTRLAAHLCMEGVSAEILVYPGVGHFTITNAARPDAAQWMADRLAGVPAPESCSELIATVFVPLIRRNSP